MFFIHWFQKHKVAANLLMLSLWTIGVFGFLQSKKEIIPPIERSFFIIEVTWPSKDNKSIEDTLCKPLEVLATNMQGVHRTEVIVQRHLCQVILYNQFELSPEERQILFNQLRFNLEKFELPSGASDIEIYNQTPEVMLARFSIVDQSGKLSYAQIHGSAESIKQKFIDAGLNNTRVRDAKKIQTHINISEYALSQHKLSLNNIGQQIQTALLPSRLGTQQIEGKQVSININPASQQLTEIQLDTVQKSKVKLSDIGNFEVGYDLPWLQSKINGHQALSISIYQSEHLSIHDMQKLIYQTQAELNVSPPLKLILIQDNTLYYQNRINLLRNNALMGLALVFSVLWIFLKLKAAFWVCIGIPTTFIASFIGFYFFGTSINMISTFAFLLIIGVIVDDAIMVAEHMMQTEQKPLSLLFKPLFFAIVTTAISFTPLFFIPGAEGQLIKQIPIVVITCLFFSMVECLLILPAHLNNTHDRSKNLKRSPKPLSQSQELLSRLSRSHYQHILKFSLNNKIIVLSLFMAVFFVSVSAVISGWQSVNLQSSIDAEIVTIDLQFPDGSNPKQFISSFERLEQEVRGFVNKVEQISRKNEIANVRSQIFANGIHGSIYLTLPTELKGSLNSLDIASALENKLHKPEHAKLMNISHTFNRQARSNFGSLRLNIESEEQAQLSESIEQLEHFSQSISGVVSSSISLSETVKQLDITPNNLAKAYNLTSLDIASAIKTRFNSAVIDAQGIMIKVQLPDDERESIWHLYQTPVPFRSEPNLPLSNIRLSQIADLKYNYTPASSRIKNGLYTAWIDIKFDEELINKSGLNQILISEFEKKNITQSLLTRISPSEKSRNEDIIIARLSLGFLLALLLMFMSMALLFNNYLQPIYVLSAIPFGIIGSLLGHLLFMQPLTIWSITGMIAVSGIVVNDNIVLVHFINHARDAGMSLESAILDAGVKRFRPIFLTTITSFIGLLPILLEQSFEAQFLIPMAISVSFGVLFATSISLILVPILHSFEKDS